jgi:hypothetical protein
MAGSFSRIDYRLRPAKAVERRMMAEAFLRLRHFASVESYRYVGLGSVYFSDFSLFHAICGFESMVSIEDEDDPTIQARFKFNVPLGKIDLRFGHSNTVLPALEWDLQTVVWLDYDGYLNKRVLTDIAYLATKLVSGSLLAVTVNADLRDAESGRKKRLQVLTERLGSTGKIPAAITGAGEIRPEQAYEIYREVLLQELVDALNDRNAGRPAGQKFSAEQIFFFKYRDGAPMLTLGWVIFHEGQRPTFNHCAFQSLSFCRTGHDPSVIAVPLLTNAEMREVNRCDAAGTFRLLSDLPLPTQEVEKFESLRRYWPLTTLSEMI